MSRREPRAASPRREPRVSSPKREPRASSPRRASSARRAATPRPKMSTENHKGLIITEEEWKRLSQRKQQPKDKSQEKKQISERLTANWINTIKKPHCTRVEKLEKRQIEEERWRKKEAENLMKQEAADRRKIIEKAKEMLYNRSAPIRKLHTALLASEVLQERQFQLEIKEKLDAVEKTKEKVLEEREFQQIRDWQRREAQLQQQKQRQARKFARKLQDQISCHLSEQEQEVEKEKEERKRLIEKAEWCEKIVEKRRIQDELDKAALRRVYDEHKAALEQLKEAEAKQERKEEERRLRADKLLQQIRNQAIAKREEIKKLKQEYITEYGKTLVELEKKRQTQMDTWIRRIQEATQEKQYIEAAKRKEIADKHLQESLLQWNSALQELQEQSVAAQREEKQLGRKLQTDYHNYVKFQRFQSKKHLEEGKKLLNIHYNQAKEAAARKMATRECMKEYIEELENQHIQEEKHFLKYAANLIKQREKAGRNVLPLVRAVQGYVEKEGRWQ